MRLEIVMVVPLIHRARDEPLDPTGSQAVNWLETVAELLKSDRPRYRVGNSL